MSRFYGSLCIYKVDQITNVEKSPNSPGIPEIQWTSNLDRQVA